jgi:hypothetical protein
MPPRNGRLTCNCCALLTKLAGNASNILSRFMPSRLFKSIISLLLAKKPATTSPNSPPSPNIHAFFRLFLPFFFSVCSCSAVMTRKFVGRVWPGAGEGSRDSMGESPPRAPPKRRRRNDMGWDALGICRAKVRCFEFISLSVVKLVWVGYHKPNKMSASFPM